MTQVVAERSADEFSVKEMLFDSKMGSAWLAQPIFSPPAAFLSVLCGKSLAGFLRASVVKGHLYPNVPAPLPVAANDPR
jgi:hypothetical protein